jgi:hypothetical protein
MPIHSGTGIGSLGASIGKEPLRVDANRNLSPREASSLLTGKAVLSQSAPKGSIRDGSRPLDAVRQTSQSALCARRRLSGRVGTTTIRCRCRVRLTAIRDRARRACTVAVGQPAVDIARIVKHEGDHAQGGAVERPVVFFRERHHPYAYGVASAERVADPSLFEPCATSVPFGVPRPFHGEARCRARTALATFWRRSRGRAGVGFFAAHSAALT